MDPSSAMRGEEAEARDRVALADAIDRCKDEIVSRWAERIRAEVPANVGPAELRDAIPDYLKELAAALRTCEADRDLAASAIGNVVDNAVKYTDAGEIHVTSEENVDRVLVHVKDNCRGLSQAELRVVFEPFERAGSDKPGTGLGLAIARRALEAQGGSIGAESAGEHGCHFWMALRRAGH